MKRTFAVITIIVLLSGTLSGCSLDFIPSTMGPESEEVQVNGDVYQFPMTYDEFAAYGWDIDIDPEKIADPDYPDGAFCTREGLEILISYSTYDDSFKPVKDCMIIGIDIDLLWKENNTADVVLPSDIKLGVATAQDVRDEYGAPSRRALDVTESYGERMNYEHESGTTFMLFFDKESGLLRRVIIRNDTRPEENS